MARETLVVPEDNLAEVIRVIRAGLIRERKISRDTRRQLTAWCDEETAYLNRLRGQAEGNEDA